MLPSFVPGHQDAHHNNVLHPRLLGEPYARPVEYATETIPVTTMLSLCQGAPFEVQVSQSFNDGNVDFEWRRGAVWTAKANGLWTPSGDVTPEDVEHIQSRVDQHLVTATVKTLKATPPCAICMSQHPKPSVEDATQVKPTPIQPKAKPNKT